MANLQLGTKITLNTIGGDHVIISPFAADNGFFFTTFQNIEGERVLKTFFGSELFENIKEVKGQMDLEEVIRLLKRGGELSGWGFDEGDFRATYGSSRSKEIKF